MRRISPSSCRLLGTWSTWLLLGVLPLFLGATEARSQEVRWVSDYQAARREAAEREKPILLDFGSDNCSWCKRLDATTLRDPAIIRLLNEQFVALKVNASRDSTLADLLRIQVYPTLVIAAPDGKILLTLEGFQEAAPLHEQMRRVVATSQTPEWMVRDLGEAGKAMQAGEYGRAIALLRPIVEDGQARAVQTKARQLLTDVEQQAVGRLVTARQHEDRGQYSDAATVLVETQRLFAGTQAARDAGAQLASLTARPELKNEIRARRARELLGQAREDYRAQQFLCCLERCDTLVAGYGELPEAVQAQQLANEIKSNPEWLQQTCDTLGDRLAALQLALAESYLKKGQPQQAMASLERVIRSFPATRHAEVAQGRLDQIQGRERWQVERRP